MLKDLRTVVGSIISIADLSRGKASKVVQEVAESGREYIMLLKFRSINQASEP